MKRSQLKQIIRQVIKEQGVPSPDFTSNPNLTPTGPTTPMNTAPGASCCETIQSLKPYIPVEKKQFYLNALSNCDCNAPNTGPTPSDPLPFVLPFVTPDNQ